MKAQPLAGERRSISAVVPAPFKVHVTTSDVTETLPCWTLDDAMDCADGYQRANCLNKDAQVSIWEGSNVSGRYVHAWRGGQVQTCVDPRHPMEKLFDKAERAGRPFVVIGHNPFASQAQRALRS